MKERPAVLAAKMDKQAAIISDADRLKSQSTSDRPGDATVNEVRTAYADAMDALRAAGGSVAAVEDVELPTDRLQPDGESA
ncbi:hypothetical protein [Haloarchaeobius sp. DFWS5]|uniref:hypothetical protein n=1 Tax=Haloarchaeobius sp. DFWS5 TaxID=3446114 RepID=UPI003EB76379